MENVGAEGSRGIIDFLKLEFVFRINIYFKKKKLDFETTINMSLRNCKILKKFVKLFIHIIIYKRKFVSIRFVLELFIFFVFDSCLFTTYDLVVRNSVN